MFTLAAFWLDTRVSREVLRCLTTVSLTCRSSSRCAHTGCWHLYCSVPCR